MTKKPEVKTGKDLLVLFGTYIAVVVGPLVALTWVVRPLESHPYLQGAYAVAYSLLVTFIGLTAVKIALVEYHRRRDVDIEVVG